MKVGLSNARFIFAQGSIRTDYFNFVYDLFKRFCQGPAFEYKGNSKLTGPYKGNRFNTLTLPCLNYYYDLFYNVDGLKIIPHNIFDLLTPIGLAAWIMDDGTFHKQGYLVLCTDSFTIPEVDLLMSVLIVKWDLKCRKERKNQNYRIVIVKSSMDKVRSLVSEHFHPSMLYKLGL